MNWPLNSSGNERDGDSLEFSKPGVSDESSQYGCEIAEAAEGMVDSSGEVFVPVEVGEEIEGQHRYEQTNKHEQWPSAGDGHLSDSKVSSKCSWEMQQWFP